jgi:hypothetical protein
MAAATGRRASLVWASALTDFTLTEHDKASALWLRLKAHFQDQLAVARMRNDYLTQSDYDTAALRGEIRTLKRLIALDADRPVIKD